MTRILNQLLACPDAFAIREARRVFGHIPEKVKKSYRSRKDVPDWIYPVLSVTVEDVFTDILFFPVGVNTDAELGALIETELHVAIDRLIEPSEGDCFPQQPYMTDRGMGWYPRRYRGKDEPGDYNNFQVEEDDRREKFREWLEKKEAEFHAVIRTSLDRRLVEALTMLWQGEKCPAIFRTTRMTLDDIKVRYQQAVAALPK